MPAWEVRQRDASEVPGAGTAFLSAESKHPLLDVANRLALQEAAQVAAAAKAAQAPEIVAAKTAAPSKADDPLGAAAVNDDPLGAVVATEDPLGAGGGNDSGAGGVVLLVGGTVAGRPTDSGSSRVADWKEKRALILKQYAATGQLKVNSDLLEADGVSAGSLGSNIDEAGPSGDKKVALDTKTRRRLEQLQEQEDDGRSVRLTQAELVARVDKLNADLKAAWRSEERVRALKIAIQVSKMLGDTSFPTFFPTVFAVVAEILDAFGELVYERVLAKGTPKGRRLVPGFTPAEVAEEGAETTKNWFYKVASIRELVPRFYVEIAILQCYRLLMPASELPAVVERLSRAIRGFGDPLAATYARSYLVHKAIDLTPLHAHSLVHGPVLDTITVFEKQLMADQEGKGPIKGMQHVKASVTPAEYFGTFRPALEWLLQSLAEYHPTQETFVQLVKVYRQRCKAALILNAIICSFSPRLVSANALPICELIKEADATFFSRHHLYVSLGRVLCDVPPPREELLQCLNDVWAELGHSKSPHNYVAVACQYLQLLLSQFGVPEVHRLLKDLLKKVTPEKAYLQMLPQLQSVVGAVLQAGGAKMGSIFVLEAFQRLLSLFDRAHSVENWKNVMEAFAASPTPFTDTTLIHNLGHIARQLHDSIDFNTFDDERRQLAVLINAYVRNVSFGSDFEAHLNFYVECRAHFHALDAVQDTLVLGAASLAMRVRSAVKGRHSKKTAAFVKACAAFAYITIPTIDSASLRVRLHLLGAQIALCNGLQAQMDAFYKAAVTLVPGCLATDDGKEPEGAAALREAHAKEEALVGLLSGGIAFLVAVPGHPKHGPFFLAQGALNVIQSTKWRLPASRPMLYAKMLALFAAYGQRTLPYRIPGVDSNDVLYASEPEYAEKLDEVIVMILTKIDESLTALSEQTSDVAAKRALATSAISLFDVTLAATTLSKPSLSLAAKLFGLACKGEPAKGQLKAAAAHVARRAKAQGGAYAELSARMQALMSPGKK